MFLWSGEVCIVFPGMPFWWIQWILSSSLGPPTQFSSIFLYLLLWAECSVSTFMISTYSLVSSQRHHSIFPNIWSFVVFVFFYYNFLLSRVQFHKLWLPQGPRFLISTDCFECLFSNSCQVLQVPLGVLEVLVYLPHTFTCHTGPFCDVCSLISKASCHIYFSS